MADNAPKSAPDLAMERLRQKDDESNTGERPLTGEQKAAIVEARQMYQAKTAEREILHQPRSARPAGGDRTAQRGTAPRHRADGGRA